MPADVTPAPLTADTVVRRADGAIEAEVGGLTVMLDLEAGSYFGLNEVGSHLWAQLTEPRSVGALAADLPTHFEVEAEEAERATLAFVEDLLGRGLAVRAEG